MHMTTRHNLRTIRYQAAHLCREVLLVGVRLVVGRDSQC
jgi:hypothetical protein